MVSWAGFEPNVFASHSVLINRPIEDVFSTIGTSERHEQVTRLSALCSEYEALQTETILLPQEMSLADTHVRGMEPTHEQMKIGFRLLARQTFELKETISFFFGLIKIQIPISGTLAWDEPSGLALYESETKSGIKVRVWKLRKFEALGKGRTRVTEVIKGHCPSWIRKMVQSQTTSGHIAHMESYHTLF